MPLGGFAPLPLRLGGSDIDGLTAEQHARIAADLAALIRVAPFACIWLTTNSNTVSGYIGQHGVGIPAAPTISSAPGIVTATWDNGYQDEYENYQAVTLKRAVATPMENNSFMAVAAITSSRSVAVRVFSSAGVAQNLAEVFLVVW